MSTVVPRVGAIWAQDLHGVLGADGDMLWRVPADFRHFKDSTLGGVVVMGRTTWESIGAPLPGRRSVVLSRQAGWTAAGADTATGLTEALSTARRLVDSLAEDPRNAAHTHLPRLWILGGGSVYAQALEQDVVDELLVSTLDLDAAAGPTGPVSGLVHAPAVEAHRWVRDEEGSDPLGTWRAVSGDAAWRVDRYLRT